MMEENSSLYVNSFKNLLSTLIAVYMSNLDLNLSWTSSTGMRIGKRDQLSIFKFEI